MLFIHSLQTTTSAHPQGENFLQMTMEGFPSTGAWMTYALGSENEQLPAFVAINGPRGLARSGKVTLVVFCCCVQDDFSARRRQRIQDDHQAA